MSELSTNFPPPALFPPRLWFNFARPASISISLQHVTTRACDRAGRCRHQDETRSIRASSFERRALVRPDFLGSSLAPTIPHQRQRQQEIFAGGGRRATKRDVQALSSYLKVSQLGVLRRRKLALEPLDDPERRGRDSHDEGDFPDERRREHEIEICINRACRQ